MMQANKNLQIKAQASSEGIAAAAAIKAWWQPSWMLALSAAWDFQAPQPRLGLAVHIENYGNIR